MKILGSPQEHHQKLLKNSYEFIDFSEMIMKLLGFGFSILNQFLENVTELLRNYEEILNTLFGNYEIIKTILGSAWEIIMQFLGNSSEMIMQ